MSQERINREEFETIFAKDSGNWNGDNALQGLLIINKYFHDYTILQAAEHDIIYSVDVDEIIEASITREDAEKLRELNWHIDTDTGSLACFV